MTEQTEQGRGSEEGGELPVPNATWAAHVVEVGLPEPVDLSQDVRVSTGRLTLTQLIHHGRV